MGGTGGHVATYNQTRSLKESGGCQRGNSGHTGDTECGELREEGTARAPSSQWSRGSLAFPRAEGGSKATGKGSFKDTLGRGGVLMGRERATFRDRIRTGLAPLLWNRGSWCARVS